MIVDCDRCTVRGDACGDCVITVLLGAPPGLVTLDGTDRRALDTLAAAGMVPRLRLMNCDEGHTSSADARTLAERSVPVVERSERHAG